MEKKTVIGSRDCFVDAVSFSTGFIRGSTFSLTPKSMDKKGMYKMNPFVMYNFSNHRPSTPQWYHFIRGPERGMFQNPCCVCRYCMSPYSYSPTEYFSRSHVFSSPLDMGKEVARQLEAEDLCDSVSQRKIRPQAKECLTFCSFMFCV